MTKAKALIVVDPAISSAITLQFTYWGLDTSGSPQSKSPSAISLVATSIKIPPDGKIHYSSTDNIHSSESGWPHWSDSEWTSIPPGTTVDTPLSITASVVETAKSGADLMAAVSAAAKAHESDLSTLIENAVKNALPQK
jgi:hypothetical protein